MKTTLKPCPLCGSKVTLSPFSLIFCKECGLELENKYEAELVSRWNTRHDEMTLKKVLLLIPELAIKILALAIFAAGVYCIFS